MFRPENFLFRFPVSNFLPHPAAVHVEKDGVEDPLTRSIIFETIHGANPSSHFPEDPFNDIGGTDPPGVFSGTIQKSEHFIQVFLQALDHFGLKHVPFLFPFEKPLFGLLLIF